MMDRKRTSGGGQHCSRRKQQSGYRVEGKMHFPVQGGQPEEGGQDFAGKKSGQIAFDPLGWNGKPYKGDTDAQTGNILDKNCLCFAKPGQDTGKRGVQIQKRTEKRQRPKKVSGFLTAEQKYAHGVSVEKEDSKRKDSKDHTEANRLGDGGGNGTAVSGCLFPGDVRHEHYRDGVGDRGRKEDQRHCHSGQNPIDA